MKIGKIRWAGPDATPERIVALSLALVPRLQPGNAYPEALASNCMGYTLPGRSPGARRVGPDPEGEESSLYSFPGSSLGMPILRLLPPIAWGIHSQAGAWERGGWGKSLGARRVGQEPGSEEGGARAWER